MIPCGLVVRIPDFYPCGLGSIPGMGRFFLYAGQAKPRNSITGQVSMPVNEF